MTLHLDAGGLIAVERRDPLAERMVRQARAAGQTWRTHGGIVGQVWRNPERQVALGKVLKAAEVVPLDASLGRDGGILWLPPEHSTCWMLPSSRSCATAIRS